MNSGLPRRQRDHDLRHDEARADPTTSPQSEADPIEPAQPDDEVDPDGDGTYIPL